MSLQYLCFIKIEKACYSVLSSIFYSIINKYIFWIIFSNRSINYIKTISHFQGATFDDLSSIDITEVFINSMCCCGFSKEENSTFILTFLSKLFSY